MIVPVMVAPLKPATGSLLNTIAVPLSVTDLSKPFIASTTGFVKALEDELLMPDALTPIAVAAA